MILGLGMDMVSVERMRKGLERFGARFLERLLTLEEREAAPPHPEALAGYVAARFAAKEAAVKALGTGFSQGIGLHDIEVRSLPGGQPSLILYGKARKRADTLGVGRIFVSLSHEHTMAGAVVVLEDPWKL